MGTSITEAVLGFDRKKCVSRPVKKVGYVAIDSIEDQTLRMEDEVGSN